MGEPLETPKAAQAFQEYCLLEDRSLAKLAQKYGRKPSYIRQLQRWSSDYQWQDRVKQYDAEQVEERKRKREAELAKMDLEHALMGRTAAIKAADLLRRRMDDNDIGAYALVQLLKIGTDLERLARGGATERQELTGKDGEPLQGAQVVFYLPKLAQEEGGDANAYSNDL